MADAPLVPSPDADSAALTPRLLAGDRLALGRAITLVENRPDQAVLLLERLHERLGHAVRIGFTGPPGVGKSTLIAALAQRLRSEKKTVGVIAVDPTSPFTGGALLGDRIRMTEVAADPEVFVRSMATRGNLGGLARATFLAVDLLDAFGKDWVLVETVGVGQSEIDVTRGTDLTVVVLSPESGDTIQTMKSGLLESADCVAINKADRPGADALAADLEQSYHLSVRSANPPPIVRCQARDGTGVDAVREAIDSVLSRISSTNGLASRRALAWEAKIAAILRSQIVESCLESPGARSRIRSSVTASLARGASPYAGIEGLLDELLQRP
ncbi:MAG: methylmalonyl Co-A mutase-associated GTPase MeaB [Planctomycetes bacterium]|nr:methylmalonyl Co-A mutase-associated GTPase MeaB [Planctomycetota bacterium]